MTLRDMHQQAIEQNFPGLENGGFGKNLANALNVDLNAEVQIAELVRNTFGKNPARYAGLTENKLNSLLSNIYEGLNLSLRAEEKIELIEKLLTQTVPSNLPMNARNCFGGNDPNGELLITQSFKGKTVLEYLNQMATSPLCDILQNQNPSFTKQKFLTSTIQDMLYAGNTQQGSMTATCAATCAQSYQITEDPEIFASRIAELVTKGKAFNPDGSVALTLPFVIPTDDRTLTNSLYQTVLMNEGALVRAGSNGYNASTDTSDGVELGEHKGIFSTELKHLLQKSTGKPHLVAYKGEDFESIIHKNLDQRMNLTAVVEGIGSGDHMFHDVRVVGMEDGFVYFVNPWPEQFLENKNGIEVLSAETGLSKMPASTFIANTQYIAYETDNPADFDKKPLALDEKDYKPGKFFTVEAEPELVSKYDFRKQLDAYKEEFTKYLEAMKKIRENGQVSKK